MAFDRTRAHEILQAAHANASLTAAVSPLKIRLMTANGSATANGTELASGGSYVAATGITCVFDAPSGGSANIQACSQTNMPAATVVGIETWDSAGTPKRWEWGALTASKTTSAGDTLSFAAAAITSALA